MSNADVYLHIKNDNVDPSRSMAFCDLVLSAPENFSHLRSQMKNPQAQAWLSSNTMSECNINKH